MNGLGQLETGHSSLVFGTLCLLMSFCLARFLHASVSRTAGGPRLTSQRYRALRSLFSSPEILGRTLSPVWVKRPPHRPLVSGEQDLKENAIKSVLEGQEWPFSRRVMAAFAFTLFYSVCDLQEGTSLTSADFSFLKFWGLDDVLDVNVYLKGFKIYLFWKEKTEIFHPLVYSPDAHTARAVQG